jgi:multiple antibiotic resistance protein
MVDWAYVAGFWSGAIISIIVISNPISTSALFIALTERMTLTEKVKLARESVTYSTATLIFFAITGMALFQLFGFTVGAFRIAGGVLLMTTAISMLNPKPRDEEVSEQAENIAIIPLSIPFTAGPGTIVTVVVLMSEALNLAEGRGWTTAILSAVGVFAGIAVTIFVSYQMMVRSEYIDARLGSGRRVVTKLMGLIVMAIAVQFIINGIKDITPEFVKIVDEARQVLMLVWY